MKSERQLLGDEDLEQSGIVANCRMNRERTLVGGNGYSRDLRFNPLAFLKEREAACGQALWLDLCCGTGKALLEAATIVAREGLRIEIVGVDLVGMFADVPSEPASLRLIQASLNEWEPDGQFDLITCVHGLHYIGDKLGLIERIAGWLADNGQFVANLDMHNIKLRDGRAAGRLVANALRRHEFDYDFQSKLLRCDGRKHVRLPFGYLGADDQAGPNYTGQPAVDSYYDRIR